jgi:hypothetical protein
MTPHTLAALILATAASALAAPPAILSVRQALPEGASPADRALPVGRYEKVELRVEAPHHRHPERRHQAMVAGRVQDFRCGRARDL